MSNIMTMGYQCQMLNFMAYQCQMSSVKAYQCQISNVMAMVYQYQGFKPELLAVKVG